MGRFKFSDSRDDPDIKGRDGAREESAARAERKTKQCTICGGTDGNHSRWCGHSGR